MSFIAIAAMSENRVIGRGSQIPWHLPEDFKWFKTCTVGKTVLMGRKTFESLGKPLSNRLNIVLTRNPRILAGSSDTSPIYARAKHSRAARAAIDRAQEQTIQPDLGASLRPTELVVWKDWEKLAAHGGDVWVVGGANVYEQTLPYCSDLYLTLVKRTVEGDVFFPPFEDQFALVEELRDTPEFKILHYRRKE